jgi:spore germination cell wall hydrolase CwlJ-like protein
MTTRQDGALIGLAVVLLIVGAGQSLPAAADDPAAEAVAKGEVLEELAAEGRPADGAAEPIEPAEAEAVDPEGEAPLKDPLTCLARTVYWEAKGEPVEAMEAVANVVMNRVADEAFPDTVCAVVTQGQDGGPCQFSWWCDGNPEDVEEPESYALTTDVARRALNQELPDHTDGSLYFHGLDAEPDWAQSFERTVTLGGHVFYRPGETAGDDG